MKDESRKRSYTMVARAVSAQATADAVLDVAVELFTERAFDDVALDDVAERAGITKRTVLRRFGSKEELFLACMARAADTMMRQRDEVPPGEVEQAVVNVMTQYERWGANRLRLLSQEDRIPIVADNVAGGRAYHREWVERTFVHLIRGPPSPARERRVAALIALTDVYMWKLLRRDLKLSLVETEQTIIELISNLKGEPE